MFKKWLKWWKNKNSDVMMEEKEEKKKRLVFQQHPHMVPICSHWASEIFGLQKNLQKTPHQWTTSAPSAAWHHGSHRRHWPSACRSTWPRAAQAATQRLCQLGPVVEPVEIPRPTGRVPSWINWLNCESYGSTTRSTQLNCGGTVLKMLMNDWFVNY